jgi:hypothetical protein
MKQNLQEKLPFKGALYFLEFFVSTIYGLDPLQTFFNVSNGVTKQLSLLIVGSNLE